AQAETFDLSHVGAMTTDGNTFAPTATMGGYATVDFQAPSVMVAAGASAQVDVTITADPALAQGSIYGGYIVLTPQVAGTAIRVPYAGFKGDYQAVQILVPTASAYPWLASKNGNAFTNQPNGATFTLS